jgi:ketosteroid isomerase-like protein
VVHSPFTAAHVYWGRQALKVEHMSNSRDCFDAIGIVVDWLDACRAGQIDELIELYDPAAVIECCEGGNFQGRAEFEKYWSPRLSQTSSDAFQIAALMTEAGGGVCLDYRDHDGRPVRTRFRFNNIGKILQTACAQIKQAA